jgi:hypothetical protein
MRKNIFFILLFSTLVVISTLQPVSNFANARTNLKEDVAGAKDATRNMLGALRRYVESTLNTIKDDTNADWIFRTSVTSIKTLYDTPDWSDQKMIRTLKQVACVFVAETHYGNLPKNTKAYDRCDQVNIGQLRKEGYEAVYRKCKSSLQPKQLEFLGAGTTCENLHPYEYPLCCESYRPNEKRYTCRHWNGDPIRCVGPEKRAYLEQADRMSATSMDNVDGKSDGKIDPIECTKTNGKKYFRIPSFPEHSVFAGILYLKDLGYEPPKSDADFARFGAEHYNNAGGTEQASFKIKLNECLRIVNEKQNTLVFETAFKRALKDIDLIANKDPKNSAENSPQTDGTSQSAPDKKSQNENAYQAFKNAREVYLKSFAQPSSSQSGTNQSTTSQSTTGSK